jgi:hypothetical protein
MTLALGEQGHNIPSVDFASGPGGNASHVLATDINGNLWIFNLATGEKQCKPRVHTSLDRENVMWVSMFQSPQGHRLTYE